MTSDDMREPSAHIIGRVHAQWASEQADVTPGGHADHEHGLLLDAPDEAQVDLLRRTADALRAGGHSPSGRRLRRLSFQRAKKYVDDYLAAEGEPLRVAGSANRIGPVWCVSEIDPERPEDILLGRALVVFDDGAVYQIGSLPPDYEINNLLDRLDPMRRPLPLDRPWPDLAHSPMGRASSGSGRTRGLAMRS